MPQNIKNKQLPPLDYLLMAARLGELYEITFPDHRQWLAETIKWNDVEQIGESVELFLQRVGKHFPVMDELIVVDVDMINWRLYSIPVVPQGFDLWHDGWNELYEPSPYLLYMMHERDGTCPTEPDEFTRLYPQHAVPLALQPERLVPTLRRMNLPEPLNGLPDLIRMLNKETDNFWLDFGEIEIAETGGYPVWDTAEVEFLTDEWKRAVPVCDRVHALLGWNNETPAAVERKIDTIHQTLLDAYQLAGNSTQLKMQFAEETTHERYSSPPPAAAPAA